MVFGKDFGGGFGEGFDRLFGGGGSYELVMLCDASWYFGAPENAYIYFQIC